MWYNGDETVESSMPTRPTRVSWIQKEMQKAENEKQELGELDIPSNLVVEDKTVLDARREAMQELSKPLPRCSWILKRLQRLRAFPTSAKRMLILIMSVVVIYSFQLLFRIMNEKNSDIKKYTGYDNCLNCWNAAMRNSGEQFFMLPCEAHYSSVYWCESVQLFSSSKINPEYNCTSDFKIKELNFDNINYHGGFVHSRSLLNFTVIFWLPLCVIWLWGATIILAEKFPSSFLFLTKAKSLLSIRTKSGPQNIFALVGLFNFGYLRLCI